MEGTQPELESEANKPRIMTPSESLQVLSPQPPSSQPSDSTGVKRKHAQIDNEAQIDGSEDAHVSKESRGAHLPEHKPSVEDGQHDHEQVTDEPLGLVVSEPRGTPKLYTGSMDGVGDESILQQFADLLTASSGVLCLVGAGLSAPSGLATWRGSNGFWNDIKLKELASPKKFEEDPVTVWKFYGERILESLAARPNAAHHALGSLAKWHGNWLTINQNVDKLLEQTEHPASGLLSLHGTLRNVRCTSCYYRIDVSSVHDIPFLLSLSNAGSQSRPMELADVPHCPECSELLRPSVVWFGERLAAGAPDSIDEWLAEEEVDLVIAAGTSLTVFPAAEWVHTVREDGASLAIFDTDPRLRDELDENDWFFQGDISVILPRILDLAIGQD